MTFTVTYRDKSGKKVQEAFEAESRAELFGQLKERHINALKIDLGAPKATRSSGVTLSSKIVKIIAAGIVLAICGICVLLFSSSEEEEIHSKKTEIKVKSKPISVTDVDLPKTVVSNSVTVKKAIEQKFGPGYYEGRKIMSASTNASGYATIITVGDDGRRKRHIVAPPPIFKHATDEVIMIALMTPEDQEIPPLPDLGGKHADEEFRASLKTPITISATDSERVRAYKEAVKLARREILERLDQGEHFADIIQDHCKLKNENGAIRLEAITELRKIEKNDGAEAAIKYRDQINDAFNRMGISPIELSEQSTNNQ